MIIYGFSCPDVLDIPSPNTISNNEISHNILLTKIVYKRRARAAGQR